MAKTNKKFETVDEMIAWVLGNTCNASRRWSLESWAHAVWDDPEAGAAWSAERSALGYAFELEDEARAEHQAKERELFARKPGEHRERNWKLKEANGSRWSTTYIDLSEELGEAIDATWTKRKGRYGNHLDNTGTVSIPTILKRLGYKGMDKEIAAATQREQDRIAKNKRNRARRQAKALAEQIVALMKNNPDVQFESDVFAIVEMVEEE